MTVIGKQFSWLALCVILFGFTCEAAQADNALQEQSALQQSLTSSNQAMSLLQEGNDQERTLSCYQDLGLDNGLDLEVGPLLLVPSDLKGKAVRDFTSETVQQVVAAAKDKPKPQKNEKQEDDPWKSVSSWFQQYRIS